MQEKQQVLPFLLCSPITFPADLRVLGMAATAASSEQDSNSVGSVPQDQPPHDGHQERWQDPPFHFRDSTTDS